jgi:hypothetical protein
MSLFNIPTSLSQNTSALHPLTDAGNHGIIIIGGRPTQPAPTTPGTDSSIIIIGGRTPAFDHQLTDNGIIIIGGNNPL